MVEVRVGNQTRMVPKHVPSAHDLAAPRVGRPVYAEASALLSNFDADADPDGWRVQIVLRDKHDQPTSPNRAQAKFQLVPRVAVQDQVGFVDADVAPVSWSKPLQFDADGIASAKLVLRRPIPSVFGARSALFPEPGLRFGVYDSRSRIVHRPLTHADHSRVVAGATRSMLGKPAWGELRIRVSVPSQGLFSTTIPVQLRPSTLVDTNWPYR